MSLRSKVKASQPGRNRAGPAEFAERGVLSLTVLKRWLARCGTAARVYRGSRLVPPDRIRIGDHVQIDEGVMIFAGQGVWLGDHVHLAFGCSISGGGWCEVGSFAGIGAGARLITGSDEIRGPGLTNPTVPPEWRSVRRGRISIGSHALIFTGSVVLPDVEIGEGAVVGAGAIVHRSLRPWAIYAGSPLVQIGTRPKAEILRTARAMATAAARQAHRRSAG